MNDYMSHKFNTIDFHLSDGELGAAGEIIVHLFFGHALWLRIHMVYREAAIAVRAISSALINCESNGPSTNKSVCHGVLLRDRLVLDGCMLGLKRVKLEYK
jgi:uncharacterized protein YraI